MRVSDIEYRLLTIICIEWLNGILVNKKRYTAPDSLIGYRVLLP